jgi:predicted acetyltransferase
MTLTSGYVQNEGELKALAGAVAWAFGGSVDESLKWLTGAGRQHVRVLARGERVQAGLLEIPMGQWFGGQSVATLGVAGVAVVPEARGQGLASRLLLDTLRNARKRGIALSTLYPATLKLYRDAGYELAGTRFSYSARARDLPRQKPALQMVPLGEAELAISEQLYRTVARETQGYLDRSPYIWDRVRAPGSKPARGVLVLGPAGPEGYLFMSQHLTGVPGHDLVLSDLVAATPGAARQLWSFLADHRSTVAKVRWYGGPSEARLFAFPERVYSMELTDYWMLRIVDVERALSARGYADVSVDLDLQIEDSVLPENSGRYRVQVRSGSATVERAQGLGKLRLRATALACLYSGFASAEQLKRAGHIDGDDAAVTALSAGFAGPAPGLCDHF